MQTWTEGQHNNRMPPAPPKGGEGNLQKTSTLKFSQILLDLRPDTSVVTSAT